MLFFWQFCFFPPFLFLPSRVGTGRLGLLLTAVVVVAVAVIVAALPWGGVVSLSLSLCVSCFFFSCFFFSLSPRLPHLSFLLSISSIYYQLLTSLLLLFFFFLVRVSLIFCFYWFLAPSFVFWFFLYFCISSSSSSSSSSSAAAASVWSLKFEVLVVKRKVCLRFLFEGVSFQHLSSRCERERKLKLCCCCCCCWLLQGFSFLFFSLWWCTDASSAGRFLRRTQKPRTTIPEELVCF